MDNQNDVPWETFEDYLKRINAEHDPLKLALVTAKLTSEMVENRLKHKLPLDEIGEDIIYALTAIRAALVLIHKDKRP